MARHRDDRRCTDHETHAVAAAAALLGAISVGHRPILLDCAGSNGPRMPSYGLLLFRTVTGMASPIDRDPLLTHVRGRGGRLYAACRKCRKRVDLDLSRLIAELGAL